MITYFCKSLHLMGGLYGGEFQTGLKFQLGKRWWDFISHVKRQQLKERIRLYAKFHHRKRSWNFTTVWANQAEAFISCKQVENNLVNGLKMIYYASGFKLEKQIDEYLSRTMLNLTLMGWWNREFAHLQ